MPRKDKRRRGGWDGTDRRDAPRVLVAVENPDAAELLRRVFERRGFRGRAVSDIDSAIVAVNEDLPRAIVIDLASKGLGTSMQLLDAIRQHDEPALRASRVIVCSHSNANRDFAFDSGADGYVVRPYHVDDLIAAVTDALQVVPEERAEFRRVLKKSER